MNKNKTEIKLPDVLANMRMIKCRSRNCNEDHKFDDPCASCSNGNWGPEFCDNMSRKAIDDFRKSIVANLETMHLMNQAANSVPHEGGEITDNQHAPTVASMVKSFTNSAGTWIKNGFAKTEEKTLVSRLNTCRACEFWNSTAFNNTGRCMKCGCSTWAKLRMATEKCPIGKW